MRWSLILFASLLACNGATVGADTALDDAAEVDAAPALVCHASATPSRLVVTADWMARSLTLLGLERVLDPGCTAADALVGTIDLSMWRPGPIELRIGPDRRTAVVSVGPGFFGGSGGSLVGNPNPEMSGALLIVDIVDRAVVAEIAIANAPMGIAIAPDGSRAYVAEMGFSGAEGHQIAVIDLPHRTLLAEVQSGGSPEEIALSADGTVGALAVDATSQVQVFQTRDVAGTITAPFTCGNDSSGLAFVPGTTHFVITNSISSTYSIVDVANPAMPVIVASPSVHTGGPYGAAAIPGTTDVLLTTGLPVALVQVSGTDANATPMRTPLSAGAFPLGVALTDDGRYALTAHLQHHLLSIVDRTTGAAHTITWLTAPGPAYVVIQPGP